MTGSYPAEIERAFAEASGGVNAARMMLDQGDSVDLSGLENHVHSLCDAIAALPIEQRQSLKHRLVALIDDLGALADALKAHHEKLSAGLRERTARTEAAAAYGPGRDPRPPGNTKK